MSHYFFMEKYDHVLKQLEEKLIAIAKENISLSKKAKQSIPLCIKALEELKLIVHKSGFKSKQDEIHFFKDFKPNISAKLLYFIQIFNIESKRPIGTDKQVKKYFTNHLKIINAFKSANITFYKYYQSEGEYLDEKFFIRNDFNLHLILEPSTLNFDVSFNTSHDQKVAQIIANHLLNEYLQAQINKLERNLFAEMAPPQVKDNNKLKWTDTKTALMELIYAIHASGSVNNGKVDVKEIAAFFETNFDLKLIDLYRNFHELKYRKTNRTKYIDELKKNLIDRMDGIDDKLN